MFDMGWSEIGIIAVVAVIAIGPKDLPRVLRTVGVWTRKARGLAGEFQRSVDDMMREAELHEVKERMMRPNAFDVAGHIEEAIDPTGEMKRALSEPLPAFDSVKPLAADAGPGAAPAGEAAAPAPVEVVEKPLPPAPTGYALGEDGMPLPPPKALAAPQPILPPEGEPFEGPKP